MPSKKLIDILDEMNLKEDTTNKMVVEKLSRLAKLIFDVDKLIARDITNSDLTFVNNMMEDLIEKPYHRITKLQIEKCNNLYKQYKELK